MHELSITESILNAALDEAQKNNADRIVSIYLCMGEISSIVPDCVREYFELLSEDTIAHGATLHFTTIPAVITCRECGNSFSIKGMRLLCPRCNSRKVSITSGREFYIDRLEIETDDSTE